MVCGRGWDTPVFCLHSPSHKCHLAREADGHRCWLSDPSLSGLLWVTCDTLPHKGAPWEGGGAQLSGEKLWTYIRMCALSSSTYPRHDSSSSGQRTAAALTLSHPVPFLRH